MQNQPTNSSSEDKTELASNIDDATQLDSSEENNESLEKELTPNPNTIVDSNDANKQNITESESITPGTVLKERFDLLEIIGQGGMGTVYKAVDKRDIEAGNSKFIAIKVLKDQYTANNNLLKALHSETRKTQSLAHPNIVTVYDFDRDNSAVFMTMEFIDGTPLNQVIKSKPQGLETEEALHIVKQIGDALTFAHSQHIIHLDLKPSNVFIDQIKRVKVFDFGIAQVNNVYQAQGFDASILGGLTPSYASLEMFERITPDATDDIYALACMTYELLAGFHPYNREPAKVALERKLVPQRIKSLNTMQWKTLLHGLQLKRKNRIQSVEFFLQGMLTKKTSKTPLITSLFILTFLPLSYYLYTQLNPVTTSPSAPKSSPVIQPPIKPIPVQEKTVEEVTASSTNNLKATIDKTGNITTDKLINQKSKQTQETLVKPSPDSIIEKDPTEKMVTTQTVLTEKKTIATEQVTTDINSAKAELTKTQAEVLNSPPVIEKNSVTTAVIESPTITNQGFKKQEIKNSTLLKSVETSIAKAKVTELSPIEAPLIENKVSTLSSINTNSIQSEIQSEKEPLKSIASITKDSANVPSTKQPQVIANDISNQKDIVNKKDIINKISTPKAESAKVITTIAPEREKTIAEAPNNQAIIVSSEVFEDEIVTIDLASNTASYQEHASPTKESVTPMQRKKYMSLKTNKKVFKIGDLFKFEFQLKSSDFVSIVVINSVGEVITLLPNPYQQDTYSQSGKSYQIPPANGDFEINIEGPAGTDTIIAIVTPQPLPKDLLTQFHSPETIKSYLTAKGLKFDSMTYRIIR